MKRRKWNGLLALFSIAGGLAGFVLGEVLLSRYSGSLHETLLMGLYFGLLALTVTLGRLLAETISPRLNGANWRSAVCGGRLEMVASGVVRAAVCRRCAVSVALRSRDRREQNGAEGLRPSAGHLGKHEGDRPGQDEPGGGQDAGEPDDAGPTGVGIAAFNENTSWIQTLASLTGDAVKRDITAKLDRAPEPSGQTDIGKALGQAVQRLTAAGTPKNRGAVILISDGFSETNVDEVTAPYISQGYRIYTVGLEMASNQDGKRSLERLAYATGEPTGRCSMRAS
ncbi:VWA domain-containing protein [Paenibacillus sp. P25]|nr:VWA domain-containing protein [Paenibacillus sp. P25]